MADTRRQWTLPRAFARLDEGHAEAAHVVRIGPPEKRADDEGLPHTQVEGHALEIAAVEAKNLAEEPENLAQSLAVQAIAEVRAVHILEMPAAGRAHVRPRDDAPALDELGVVRYRVGASRHLYGKRTLGRCPCRGICAISMQARCSRRASGRASLRRRRRTRFTSARGPGGPSTSSASTRSIPPASNCSC